MFGDGFIEPEPVFVGGTAEGAELGRLVMAEQVWDVLNLGGLEARIRAQCTLKRVKPAMGLNY